MDTKNKIKLTGLPQTTDRQITVPDRFENRISFFDPLVKALSKNASSPFSLHEILTVDQAYASGFDIPTDLSDLEWLTATILLRVAEEKSTEDLPLEVWVIDGEVRLVTHDGGTRLDLTDQWLDEEEKITREFTSKIFG